MLSLPLAAACEVTAAVYDALGRRVARRVAPVFGGPLATGLPRVALPMAGFAPGASRVCVAGVHGVPHGL